MSDSLRLLIVGVGSIGERHVRCFQSTGRCELAVCEVNADLRAAVSRRYGIDLAYASLESAFVAEHYDAAVVATPAPLHVPLATQLARHGPHLLIEKPLGVTCEGVDQLSEIVADNQLVVAVGYNQRAHPLNQAARQFIEDDQLGRPLQAVFHMGQNFPAYRPAYRDTYYVDHAQGGGAIQDAMTHAINLGEWLLGPVDRVVTDAAHQALGGVTVEDTVHTLARHGNILASYALNQYQAPNEMTYTLVFEDGTLRVDYARSRYSWMTEPDTPWQHEPIPAPERDSIYVRQANDFLDACQGEGQPLCTLPEGLQSLRVNLASLRSVDERCWQDVTID